MRVLARWLFILYLCVWAGASQAQNPVAPPQPNPVLQAEIVFWESVKDSKDPAELQAYLDKYPQGTFSALARLRLSRLVPGGAAQAKPAAASGPVAPDGPLPKVGDTWTYRYTDLWNPKDPQEITYTVTSAGEAGIEDTRKGPKVQDEFLYTPLPTMTQRAGTKYEFSPYQLAFGPLPPNLSFKLQFGAADYVSRNWSITGKVIGTEKITVPAGSFETVKVELRGVRSIADSSREIEPTSMTQTLWYSGQVKRIVKYSVRTEGMRGVHDQDIYELLSYKLN